MFTLEDILSIPTYSVNEIRMQEYLLELLPNFSGVTVEIDEKGNIYATKGKTNGHYPCVMAHMDTVHRDHDILIKTNDSLNLKCFLHLLTS